MILRRWVPVRANRTLIAALLDSGGAPVAGDAAATIGDITAAGAGSAGVNGTGAATIGAVEAAGNGTLGAAVTGGGTATLGGVTAAGAGSVGANGTAGATLGAFTTASAGSAAIVGTAAATIGGLTATGKAYVLVGACVGGVLTVDPTNGRYFRDDTGIVILAGSHTWHEFQDSGISYPPDPFDYEAWLDFIDSFGHNYHKIWHMETAYRWPSAERYFTPNVWQRTGPGNAADGLPKFDLDKFYEPYFERLRERVILAGNRGHYVVVQLFQGWHIEIKNGGPYQPFTCHPMQAGNNINGIDGDTDNDGAGEETRDESISAITAYQRAYVRKVVDTVNDLDNVLFEISNEDTAGSVPWQHNLVDYIHTYEAGLPKQHPVGMTVLYPSGDNADLFSSNAEWISPNGSLSAPAATDGSKVVLWDIDHISGTTSDYLWVWRAFCRGNNLAYMDEYIGYAGGNDTTDATHDKIRANLGRVLVHAAQLDLANATPQGALSSTGFCLAKTAAPAQLVAYQDGAGAFTVNLTSLPGTFSLQWLRPSTGATQAGSNVAGGAVRTLTPPWGDDAVAFLVLAGYSATGAATLGGLTAAGAASAGVNGTGAATIGAVAAVAAGVVAVAGAGQAAIGALAVVAAAGSVAVNGAVAALIGVVEAAGTASAAINGDAAATVGALEAAGAGTTSSGSVSGGAAAVIGDIVAVGAGSVAVNGAAAAVVGAFVAVSVVAVAVNGTGAAELGAFEASGYGGSGAGGAATATIGDIVAAGVGSVAIGGAGLVTIGDIVATGLATVPASGAAVATLGALVAAGGGSVAVTGGCSVVIGAIVASGSGALTDLPEIHGTGAATIGAIIANGAGVVAWVLAIARVSGPGGAGAVSGPGAKSSIGE